MALAIIPLSGIVCPPVTSGTRMPTNRTGAASTTPYTPTATPMFTPSTPMDAASRALAGAAADAAATRVAPVSTQPRDGAHDFDFIEGRWRVHNRRLHRPLSGSNDWYEFEGRAVERTLWDGRANFEEYDAELPSGRMRAVALRLYNPASRQWSIHWSNSAAGTLDRPMVGEFREGRGEFYCQDDYEGRAILQRFIWTSSGPDACRWEQAFSADGGQSWETNWIMEFTRAS